MAETTDSSPRPFGWRRSAAPWIGAITVALLLWVVTAVDRGGAGRLVQKLAGAVVQTVRRHGGVVAAVLGALTLLTWLVIAACCWRERCRRDPTPPRA